MLGHRHLLAAGNPIVQCLSSGLVQGIDLPALIDLAQALADLSACRNHPP
jgi:hypothetical protein